MASATPLQHLHQCDDDDSKRRGFKLNLNFLKIGSEKKTTKDGQPVKRPGPKPGTTGPPSTRRRELNRQAQRTHRERKEVYIKALEDEVLRMKEACSNMSREKTQLAEDNRQVKAENHLLRRLLSDNCIDTSIISVAAESRPEIDENQPATPVIQFASAAPTSSVTGSQAATTAGSRNVSVGHAGGVVGVSPFGDSPGDSFNDPTFDYDQAGIEFVLTLEKPCMTEHIPWLLTGYEVGPAEPCGHAIMASCPPEPFPGVGQETWELKKSDLTTLLELSKRLDLDGEVTPVMAWGMVLAHPRLGELDTAQDFAWLTRELGSRAKCHGFGAVMEEFEVRDAIETILSAKAPGGFSLASL